MEKITRGTTSKNVSKKKLESLNLDIFDFEGNVIPAPQVQKKDIEWENDTTVFKRGRVKVTRNKRQSKYDITGLTKAEFNRIREIL